MPRRLQNRESDTYVNQTAIVSHVILTLDDEYIKSLHKDDTQNYEELSFEDIGSILARPSSDSISFKNNKTKYRPWDTHNVDYPLIGETVDLIYSGDVAYYKRQSSSNINTGNASSNSDLDAYPNIEKSNKNKSSSYREVSNTGTSNTDSKTNQERKTKIGEYFEPTKINQLKPYEGDKIIQSRFGQSIRFSGYNNSNNVFSPTIILRNGQGDVNTKINSIIEEDINNDGSTILIGSGEYQSDFVATTSVEKTKFEKYPNELKGNQLILNSDRIILSSRQGEMIFHSKLSTGFITDGKFSIDGAKGADFHLGGDVNITTTREDQKNFSVLTGTGKIFLNTNTSGKSPNTDFKNEPLVRGNTLKKLLEDMIDLIVEQVYRTPSGPTAVGPENKKEFNELKRRLSEMLSTLNYTE